MFGEFQMDGLVWKNFGSMDLSGIRPVLNGVKNFGMAGVTNNVRLIIKSRLRGKLDTLIIANIVTL